MPSLRFALCLLMSVVWLASSAHADVVLPAIISDHMVLQAQKPLEIWGWAAPGEEISLTLGDDRVRVVADRGGDWRATLPARKASDDSLELVVEGRNTIRVRDVLVGEVWLGSGQSNMAWPVSISSNSKQEIAQAKYPRIRMFFTPVATSGTPLTRISAGWVVCSPETVPGFSAVLYFFGQRLHRELEVPVGLIATSVGGTRIEPWMPPAGFELIPELEAERKSIAEQLASHRQARIEHVRGIRKWLEQAGPLADAGNDFPDPPAPPAHPLNRFDGPTALYNAMIHPLVPYTLRGAIWYQGESNRGQGLHYHELQQGLIAGWRKVWNQGDFPFLYVQLAPFRYDDNVTALPEIWEAQTAGLTIPGTGMAVTTDISTIGDIHPPNKRDVGSRLALWALAKTYGRELIHSGPLYKSFAVEQDAIRVRFEHAPGLKSRDGGPLTWFSLAGADKRFHRASAEIEGQTVVVRSPSVTEPVAVRFGWHQIAEPNLVNAASLPASPFRTDRWTDAVNAPAE